MSEANRDEWQGWRTNTAIRCDSQKRLMAPYVLSDLSVVIAGLIHHLPLEVSQHWI